MSFVSPERSNVLRCKNSWHYSRWNFQHFKYCRILVTGTLTWFKRKPTCTYICNPEQALSFEKSNIITQKDFSTRTQFSTGKAWKMLITSLRVLHLWERRNIPMLCQTATVYSICDLMPTFESVTNQVQVRLIWQRTECPVPNGMTRKDRKLHIRKFTCFFFLKKDLPQVCAFNYHN